MLLVCASSAAALEIIQVANGSEFQSALGTVSEGGTIEMLSGTYVAPLGGFVISNAGKSFTISQAAGATVTLTGSGSVPVLILMNASAGTGDSVVFRDLTFDSGYSNQNGVGAGVTVSAADATFIGCTFQNNVTEAGTTGGGGVFAWGDSVVHFSNCVWSNNTSTNEGGGLRVDESKAFVHDSRFVDNRTNVSGHRNSAAGGGIHISNSTLRISNTRFSGNRAGCVGGAVYAIGSWSDPVTNPSADLLITNSTFTDNAVIPDAGVSCVFAPVGGAIHTEDQTTSKVFSSRFDLNIANIGGAISQYRSILEVHDSQFMNNSATGTGAAGFGGAIMSNSNDANDSSTGNGTINRRAVELTIEDSLFVGQSDGQGSNSLKGGCVFVEGDMTRTYGSPVVPQMGTAATNRATVRIRRSVFTHCRVEEEAQTVGTGAGGALEVGHADLEITDSLLMANTAVGDTQSSGGGIRILYESLALLQNTTFAHNAAGSRSGAVHVFGSDVDIDGCEFFGNQVTTGGPGSVIWARPAPEGWYWSTGGGTYENPDVDVSGSVFDSTFVDNPGIDIEERDFDLGPINGLQYSNNDFYDPTPGSTVFNNELTGGKTVATLNSLTVTRSGASNTDKAPSSDNHELVSAPELGALLATPPAIYQTNAAGDPAPPTDAYLASAWSGGSATIDATSLSGATGTDLRTGSSGSHTLMVSSSPFVDSLATAVLPDATLTANPDVIFDGSSADLNWTTWTGTYLDMSLDRAVSVGTPGASGTESESPSATTTYDFHVVTEEGGYWVGATIWVEEVLSQIFSDGFESGSMSAWSATAP